MRLLKVLQKFYQDNMCTEHDELPNLWRMQGHCIYCGKVWRPCISKQDIDIELARRRTEQQRNLLTKLRGLDDEEIAKLKEL